jgi:hypothetical protein
LLSSLIAVACYLIGAAVLGLSAYRADAHLDRGGRLAAAAITLVGSPPRSLLLVAQRPPGRARSRHRLDRGSSSRLWVPHALRLRPAGVALLLVIAAALEAGFSGRTALRSKPWELTFTSRSRHGVRHADDRRGAPPTQWWIGGLKSPAARRTAIFSPLEPPKLLPGDPRRIPAAHLALVSGAFFIENLFSSTRP